MNKFTLGQRVKYTAIMKRNKGGLKCHWWRKVYNGGGIIIGKRTVSDGFTDTGYEGASIYVPTEYHSFWLVTHKLSAYRYVAEEDLEAIDD